MDSTQIPPPNQSGAGRSGMVDRGQRNRLAALIRRYLAGEVRSYGFQEQLAEFRDSPDSAVRFVAKQEWIFYGDTEDIPALLSKPEWDFTQRLLLLLESDCVVRETVSLQWSVTQGFALLALLGLLWIGDQQGWGYHLLALAIPFGLVPAVIMWVGDDSPPSPSDQALFPFANIPELKSVCQAVGFRKARYPERMKEQLLGLRPGSTSQITMYLVLLILSPILLFSQVFPSKKTYVRVVTA